MDDKEIMKLAKTDLENFNSRIEMLRQYELEIDRLHKQENPQSEEITLLELKMKRIKLNIDIMRNSLQILTSRELKIITDYYFANNSTKNIAMELDLTKESICVIRCRALKRLANCMYTGVKELPFLLDYRKIPGENIKKKRVIKPVYQYDMENNFIKKWDSAKECSKNNFDYNSVRRCCAGEYKQYKGYKWSYELLKAN